MKEAISNDPNTGSDLQQTNRPDAEPLYTAQKAPRECYGIEQLHLRAVCERNLQVLCNKVLEAIDGSVDGCTFTEICRTSAKPPYREAVLRCIEDGIIWADDSNPQVLRRTKP